MFVHVNPEPTAIGETISTLKFAERVSSIELGAARSNKESGEIRELKEEVCSYFYIVLTNEMFSVWNLEMICCMFRYRTLSKHWRRGKQN